MQAAWRSLILQALSTKLVTTYTRIPSIVSANCPPVPPVEVNSARQFSRFGYLSATMELKTDTSPQQLNFIQRINKDGASEWVVASEDYDYNQEIARAAYGDMLHDHNRNVRYYDAIKLAVQHRHAAQEKAIVLDIGTGTGLLSMMALAAGADTVFACEAFKPMADCADKVLKRNNYRDRVKLIPKRSTDLQIGPEKDLPCRANILVAEVFDTELIGEGAIDVFNHAKHKLTTPDCIVIPSRANVFAQVVSWTLLNKWNKLQDFHSNGVCVKYPDNQNSRNCAGIPSVHDLQLTQAKDFTQISEEILIFEFNWNKIQPITRTNSIRFQALNEAESYGIFLWWDLIMYEGEKWTSEENIIACRPNWSGKYHWRDHWMQAAYYLPPEFRMEKSASYTLECAHDEFSFWFKINDASSPHPIEPQHPVCVCGLHLYLSRSRFGLLNDEKRRSRYFTSVRQIIKPGESVVLIISDGSFLGLMAARLNAKKVFILETDSSTAKLTKSFLELNQLDAKVLEKSNAELTLDDFDNLKVDVVVGEPYFQTAAEPWNHMTHFRDALKSLSWNFSPDVRVEPKTARIMCVAMNYEHLWKINSPVGTVCGFDLADFDDLITKSSKFADAAIDSQPLWEYPGTACSEEVVFESIDFQESSRATNNTTTPRSCPAAPVVALNPEGCPNGLAFWIEYNIGNEVVSTGVDPDSRPVSLIGKQPDWDPNWKQGVYFFKGNKMKSFTEWWQARQAARIS